MQKQTAKGTIVAIGTVQTFGSGFTKLDLIVDVSDNANFPAPVPFTFKKDKTALVKDFQAGEQVEVDYLLGGRKWAGPNGTRYFVDLTGWAIRHIGETPQNSPAGASATVQAGKDTPDEELPF